MGNCEEAKSTKAEKPSSPTTIDQANQSTQTNIPVYPDWGAMQAYYGPRVTLPPYYNSAMASGHPPHPYMWGPPQPMMPPYGAPYAAIYSHGGIYTPAALPLGPDSYGQGFPSSSAIATPQSMETPTKSSGNTDQGVVKKSKGFDVLVMAVGNGNTENEGGAEHRVSQSLDNDTKASSDGSDGHTSGANRPRRKRSREATPSTDGKAEETQTSSVFEKEIVTPVKEMEAATVPGRPVLSPGIATASELQNTSTVRAKTNPSNVDQSCAAVPSDAWLQNDRELKREKRKQSNRESARRSRLRKQAEAEELARKVECLISENVTLKSEINRLTETSEKTRAENAELMKKLNNAQLGHSRDMVLNRIDKRDTPKSTKNLLSRVNSASNDRTDDEESSKYDRKSNPGAKLHQLLDTNPRADAVAAG